MSLGRQSGDHVLKKNQESNAWLGEPSPIDRYFGEWITRQGRLDLAQIGAWVSSASRAGHAYLPFKKLESLLSVSEPLNKTIPSSRKRNKLEQILCDDLVLGDGSFPTSLVKTDDGIYLYRCWKQEQQLVDALVQRLNKPISILEKASSVVEPFEPSKMGEVAKTLLSGTSFLCISGGPGTGKSTLVKGLLEQFIKDFSARFSNRLPVIALTAPTGKAVERLNGIIKQSYIEKACLSAMTLHRLLKIPQNNKAAPYGPHNPLALDLLLVDESSMCSLSLFSQLVFSITEETKLVLVGDPNQLPPIEVGSPFQDLCELMQGFSTKTIACLNHRWPGFTSEQKKLVLDKRVHLTHTFRFRADSGIAECTQAIATSDEKRLLHALNHVWPDLVWHKNGTDQIHHLLDSHRQNGSNTMALASPDAIWTQRQNWICLTPTQQGPLGSLALNHYYAPEAAALSQKACLPWGTPVLVNRNLNDLGLMNGEIGLSWGSSWKHVQTDRMQAFCEYVWFLKKGQKHCFKLSELCDEFALGYVLTVHKAQGSEYPEVWVVIPEDASATHLMTQSWLYTAITRAKSKLVLFSSEEQLKAILKRKPYKLGGLRNRLAGALDRN